MQTGDARKLILKVVNALSAKIEIGSPMASMYLLQNPDHYTSHKFIPFWWKSFVNDVRGSQFVNNTAINSDDDDDDDEDENENENYENITNIENDPNDEKLLILQNGKDYIASSKVDDYKYRPEAYNIISLYDW
ncbi:hypothetical protein BYT27DRAFT_7085327, partial [Phlegmacium glaucopus]